MIRIAFNIAPVIARLGRVRETLADMTPINQEIGEYMVKATRDRFRSSTAPDGSTWQAKKPATIARYKARGDGNKTKPLIGPSGRLGREIAQVATRDQVEIGSALEYSGVMQGGARKGAFGVDKRGKPLPWGDIPARVWLGISETDEHAIVNIVDQGFIRPAIDSGS